MSEWLDMETAPKDGRLFLGLCSDAGNLVYPFVYVFRWEHGSWIGGAYGQSVHRLVGWLPMPDWIDFIAARRAPLDADSEAP